MKNTISNYQTRFDELSPQLKNIYLDVYKDNIYYDVEPMFTSLLNMLDNYNTSRNSAYKKADVTRANWHKKNSVIGTTLYVDLFSKDFKNFTKYIPYFKELGINLIHFMPILQSRAGDNDGGYAVQDYKQIDSRFGSNEDFDLVIKKLKSAKIHVCVDFVVNHTAKEHEFAQKALSGDINYMNMYFMYDNDIIPKQFDQTVPEVFPKVSPGNFTYYEKINKWVFTSFYNYQWDLNYQNPIVFHKIVDILLHLANKGIDMIRLDAIPFMWKQLGHSCRNHPTIHKLLQMFNLIIKIVAPSVVLLGEAIVEAEEIVKYSGLEQAECDLMYNATHMVNLWNSMATRDTRLLQTDIMRLHLPSDGVWINYARCHDDIGWGFNEAKLASMGFDPFAHKQFLIHYYKGDFKGSFSTGELYEFNPANLDARNCGTMASLLGLEKALLNHDKYQEELALKRIHLMNGILLSSSGIPLIYSGDEIGTLNNYDYLKDQRKAHDTRWIHRSEFNHQLAKNRKKLGTKEYNIFNNLKNLIELRKSNHIFDSTIGQQVINTYNNHIYSFYKQDREEVLLCVYNFSEDRQLISCKEFNLHNMNGDYKDMITGKIIKMNEEDFLLGPYEYLWLMPLS